MVSFPTDWLACCRPRSFPVKGQPKGLSASASGQIFVAASNGITSYDDKGSPTLTETAYKPSSITSTANGLVAVGAEVRIGEHSDGILDSTLILEL